MHSIKSVALLILLIFILPTMAIARDVTLAWDPSTDASGYRLYARERGESYAYNDPEWQGTSSQCTVTGFDEYESYYFVVRAYDSDGNESGDSNEVYLASLSDGESSDNALEGGDSSGTSSSGGGGCFISSIFGQ